MKQRIHRDQPENLAAAMAEIQRLRHKIDMLELSYNDNEIVWWSEYLVRQIETMRATEKIAAENWQRQISMLAAKQYTR